MFKERIIKLDILLFGYKILIRTRRLSKIEWPAKLQVGLL